MFSHIMVGVTDLERARAFYTPILDALGVEALVLEPEMPWAAWRSSPQRRPLLVLGRPHDGQPHHPGNGQMVALMASSREMVDQVHALALSLGAPCEGKPGLRPQYHAHYYGAYFRDPDGNKLCVAHHDPV